MGIPNKTTSKQNSSESNEKRCYFFDNVVEMRNDPAFFDLESSRTGQNFSK